MAKRIVKNYPSPRLMETIGATNQKPAEAIGELVANCFDARIDNNKMDIIVDMRNKCIVVTDNGKGMTFDVLEKAVCIAEDMSKHIDRREGAKGHFGMGFKTSCSTLGKFYEIYTKPVEENVEYHVSFDISDYSNRPTGADAWDIEIEEELSFADSPLIGKKEGTSFVIRRLKDEHIIVSAVLEYLGEAFKGHLDMGDTITIINEFGEKLQATAKAYNFIDGSKISIDEMVAVGDKQCNITGWMALDSTTHNGTNYGFNIYRHKQLVETWDKSWFNAHLMTSRIIGEVNMDFLEATFYKQGTQQSESWMLSSIHMREYLKPIVKASRDISKSGNINKPVERKKIIEELNRAYHIDYTVNLGDSEATSNNDNVGNNNGDDNESCNGGGGTDSNATSVNDNIRSIVKEQSLVLENHGEIQITYHEVEHSKIEVPFDYIYEEANEFNDKAELSVIVYKNNPLWSKPVDSEVKRILATSDAIYRMLVEQLHFDTSEALNIRNAWVRNRTFK